MPTRHAATPRRRDERRPCGRRRSLKARAWSAPPHRLLGGRVRNVGCSRRRARADPHSYPARSPADGRPVTPLPLAHGLDVPGGGTLLHGGMSQPGLRSVARPPDPPLGSAWPRVAATRLWKRAGCSPYPERGARERLAPAATGACDLRARPGPGARRPGTPRSSGDRRPRLAGSTGTRRAAPGSTSHHRRSISAARGLDPRPVPDKRRSGRLAPPPARRSPTAREFGARATPGRAQASLAPSGTTPLVA